MNNYYVTYSYGSNLKNCYSIVTANTYEEARVILGKSIDNAFAFCYEEVNFAGQAEKFGLKLVELQKQVML